jgi:tetratricopeptide (TPR) repeat protein
LPLANASPHTPPPKAQSPHADRSHTLTPPPSPHLTRFLLLVATCAVSLLPALTLADDLDDLSARVADTNKNIEQIRNQYIGRIDFDNASEIDARLQEGMVLMELGDPARASVIFLDIVSRDEWKGKTAYTRAYFLLARSLYLSGNRHTARKWLKRSIEEGNPDDRQAAVAMFIELAIQDKRLLAQSDWDDLERLFQQISSSLSTLQPELLYARGKGLYARSQFEEANNNPAASSSLNDALRTFSTLDVNHPTGLAARYFAGVCRVKLADFDGALSDFQTVIDTAQQVPGQTPEQIRQLSEITDLSHIARARIFYERKQWTESLDAYQHIPRTSPHFDQVLFEITWLHISQKDFVMALRHIDILLLSRPDSVFMPDAKRLRADLLKNQGEFGKAIDTYEDLLETFDPALASLNAMVDGQSDPLLYFQNLVAQDRLGTANYLPEDIARWAPPNERMDEAVKMVKSLGQSYENTEEVKLLIREIESAIESDNRYQLFPGLREAWLLVMSVENRTLSLHRDLNITEANLLPQSSPQLEAASQERAAAEAAFASIPQNRDEFLLRSQRLAADLETRKLRAYRLRALIEASQSKVNAIDQWLRLNSAKVSLGAQQEGELRAGIIQARSDIETMTAELRDVDHQIRILDTLGGVDAGLAEHENNVRKTLKLALIRERDAMQPLRAQDPKFQRIDQLRADLDRADADLGSLRTQLTASIDARITDVRRRLGSEKELVQKYTVDYNQLRGDVQLIAGAIAYQHWDQVRTLFGDLVLAADMGVVDVAWLKKEATTEKLDNLKDERNRENDVLKQDFEQVLRESGQSTTP